MQRFYLFGLAILIGLGTQSLLSNGQPSAPAEQKQAAPTQEQGKAPQQPAKPADQPGNSDQPPAEKTEAADEPAPKPEVLFNAHAKVKTLSGYLTIVGQEGGNYWIAVYRVDYQHPNKFRLEPIAGQLPRGRLRMISNGTQVLVEDLAKAKRQTLSWDEFRKKEIGGGNVNLLLRWLLAPNSLKTIVETVMTLTAEKEPQKIGSTSCQLIRLKPRLSNSKLELSFWVGTDGIPRQIIARTPTKQGELIIQEQWSEVQLNKPVPSNRFLIEVPKPEKKPKS